jgi:hypothetical protein
VKWFDEILILVIGMAIGCLIGFPWGAAKVGSGYMKDAIAHGCAEMAPDTTVKTFQWRKSP